MLREKDIMPNFSVLGSNGINYTKDSFSGKLSVIYFYPKDNTKGCTMEANSINEYFDEIKALGVELVGVSPDTIKKHENFIAKNNLKFPLLFDEDHKMCEMFGVWAEKKMYGKTYFGVLRSTFVFNENFEIIKVFDKVKVGTHGQELLEFLKNL